MGLLRTELLLDDLENLLLVEFLGKTLDRGQGLTTISLCKLVRISVSSVAGEAA